MTTKITPAFEQARNELASALGELESAEAEYGELLNCETRLVDDLEALKASFKATSESDVEKKSRLTLQLNETLSASRAIESRRLPKCRESVAGALAGCVDVYRRQLQAEIDAERTSLVKTLRPYFRDETSAVSAAERTDKLKCWMNHRAVQWSHTPDSATAVLVLSRMNNAMEGRPLIAWPSVGVSPG